MNLETAFKKYLFAPPVEIKSHNGYTVEVWSSVNNKPANPYSKTVEFEDDVFLFPVVKYKGKYYSSNEKLSKQKQILPLENLSKKVKFEWYKVEPEYHYYIHKNEYHRFSKHWCKVMDMGELKYAQKKIAGNQDKVNLSQSSFTNKSIYLEGKPVGTMRYKCKVKINGKWISSSGIKELNTGRFEEMDKVHRISVRGNTGKDKLDEGFARANLPYFWGSDSYAWGWYGSDCAKFTSVSYKAAGKPMGYIGTYYLNQMKARTKLTKKSNNIFYSGDKKVKYGEDVEAGDIIVMRNSKRGHAGLIGEDKNNNGYLDGSDYVLHTSFGAPKFEPLNHSAWSKKRVLDNYEVKIISK